MCSCQVGFIGTIIGAYFIIITCFSVNYHILCFRTFNSIKGHAKVASLSHLKEGLKNRMKTAMDSEDLQDITTASTALLSCSENFLLGHEVLDSMLLDILRYLEKALQLFRVSLR